jgi:iron(III) transport system substrate-binding protein
MSITRRAFLASGAAVAAVTAESLWRNQSSNAQGANQTVTVYSARHYDTDNVIYDSFTRKTGIKVNIVSADADQLIERIRNEGRNSPADLFVTADGGRLWRAQQAGILQPVNSPVLTRAVPAEFRDKGGLWFGLSRRARVIMYNKAKVKPSELSTYLDLANPKWKGRLISRSSTHVYNQSLTGAMLAHLGPARTEQWVKGVTANFARPPEGNDTAQIRAVAAGVADLTFVNTYYLPRLAKSTKPEDQEVAAKIGVFFPDQGPGQKGTHVNISGAGVLKTAPNQMAAVRLLEHLVSRDAQSVYARSNNEYPIIAGVALDPVLASYGNFRSDRLSAAVYGSLNNEALKIMERGGWR